MIDLFISDQEINMNASWSWKIETETFWDLQNTTAMYWNDLMHQILTFASWQCKYASIPSNQRQNPAGTT